MFSRRTNWDLATNRVSEATDAHRRGGAELLDLTESNPTQAGLTYDAVSILSSLVNPLALTYRPDPRGLRVAREAVAGYYREAAGVAVDPQQIVLTTSTSEAYSFVFRLLCDPDDEVLIPTPSYPLFEFLAGLQDIRLRPYQLVYDHGWQVDLHSLEQAISPRARAVMVVHPNNPTGSFVSDAERSRINQLCRAHGAAIVADEVFLDYPIMGHPAAPSFAANQDALTFTLSGLSKIAGLPQMKVAWVVVSGPAELRELALARLEVIADTFLSMNAPLQYAVPGLLAQREKVGAQLRSRTAQNLAELDAQLASQKLCSRLDVEAGWYAILRVPAHGSDEDLVIDVLRDTGVLVQPGYFYDFHADGFLIISLITPPDIFREGLRRLLRYIAER